MNALHRFQIHGELGSGGFASVYRAFDPLLGQDVALKVLHPHIAADPDERERFLREAAALGRLRHPNIVALLESGEDSGGVWHVTELVEGRSLSELVAEQGAIAGEAVAAIAVQLASALAALHARGLIHRDIKPANILVEQGSGRAVLLDLGVARDQRNLSRAHGVIVGTPAFMAPEQVRAGGEITTGTDVYQLGATLYTLLTGSPPFAGEQQAVLDAVRMREPLHPRLLRSTLPDAAAAVLLQALAKQPALRPAGPRELVDALVAALSQPAVPSLPHNTSTASAPATPPLSVAAFTAPASAPTVAGQPPARPARGGDTLCAPLAGLLEQPTEQAITGADQPPIWSAAVTAQAWDRPAAYVPAPAHAWPAPAAYPVRSNRNRWLAAVAGVAALAGVIWLAESGGAQAHPPTVAATPALPPVIPATSTPGGGTVLLRDDFNDPSKGVLPRQSPNPSDVRMGYDNGEYVVEKRNPNTEGYTPVLVGTFDNSTITIEARLTGDTRGRAVAVACRASFNGWYQLALDPTTGLFVLERVEQNTTTPLSGVMPAPRINRGGGKNQLSLTCAGNRIRARINGVEVARATDDRFKRGQTAFLVFAPGSERRTAAARFDNLLIESAKP